ncbi:NADH:ubiquinone oxidoreductase subunit 6 (subunit J) [Bradyrhizobium sp. S3.3.6]|uniref:hypothetical protein n=1 Tax=Bradyrhizobium sp. S3.3.6 TaxID=3156429 RepID=UPI0033977968
MNDAPMNDTGLAAWLRKNIENPLVRQALLVVVGLVLIGTFILKAFSGIAAALEVLGIEICFIYISLLVVTTTVAVWPLDQGTKNTSPMGRIRQSARGGILVLILLGLFISLYVVNVINPIWPSLRFEIAYQELRAGIITVDDFFHRIPLADRDGGDAVTDVSDPGAIFEDNHIVDLRKLLRMMSLHSQFVVTNLDLRGMRHTAVIAARKVVFDTQSVIQLARTNLLIIAGEIEVKAKPASGAAIFAYRSDDVPAVSINGAGQNGASAGTVTIVVLSKFVDGPPLMIDVRGQSGGQGSRGLQPGPEASPKDKDEARGRPDWKFGERSSDQIKSRITTIDEVLECQNHYTENCKVKEISGNLGPEYILKLSNLKSFLQGCAEQKGRCNLEFCVDTDWESIGEGDNGSPGLTGGQGGKGGSPGDAGHLSIYGFKPNPETETQFGGHFHWINDTPVSQPSPEANPGKGGEGGTGGEGAPGGRGRKADPLGLCRAGNPGHIGVSGQPGPRGPDGDRKNSAARASIYLLPGLTSD